MHILLTGATGFIGRNLLIRFINKPDIIRIYLPVRSLQKLTEQLIEEGFVKLPDKLSAWKADASDWRIPTGLKIDTAIHTAGVISSQGIGTYRDVNALGTNELCRQLPKETRLIVLSSLAAAGPNKDGTSPKTEVDLEEPVTNYGRSKLEMEKILKNESSARSVILLRPPMVLGARDSASLPLFKMAYGPFMIKAGKRIQELSFLHVKDLVDGIICAIESPSKWPAVGVETYFIAATKTVSDIELLDNTALLCRQRVLRKIVIPSVFVKLAAVLINVFPRLSVLVPNLCDDRVNEILATRWVVSSERFSTQFGWIARFTLHEALEEARDWYIRTGQLRTFTRSPENNVP